MSEGTMAMHCTGRQRTVPSKRLESRSLRELMLTREFHISVGGAFGQVRRPLHPNLCRMITIRGYIGMDMEIDVDYAGGEDGSDPSEVVAIYEIDSRWPTPLMRAVLRGDLRFIEFLLEAGADANARDIRGCTALKRLTSRGCNLPAMRMLLDHGADPDIADNAGEGPLHLAILTNREAEVRLLLEYGANRHLSDYDDRSPLERAEDMGNNSIIGRL
ncbi:ankyrin repeat-containing domain protein [Aspergillus recurvatus]